MAIDVECYLRYLHDLSRRILQRSGMEQVLYRKRGSKDPKYQPYESTKNDLDRYFRGVSSDLKDDSARALFFGLGLVAGTIHTSGGWSASRRIAGPLAYCPVELGTDDEDGADDWRIKWDEASLNYDLLTVLLQQGDEEAAQESWIPQAPLSAVELAGLRSVEALLDSFGSTFVGEKPPRTEQLVDQLLAAMQDGVVACRSIKMAQQPFCGPLDSWVEKESLSVFGHGYFFIANVPDQLSSTVALRRLLQESDGGGLGESLIGQMLGAALRGEKMELERVEVEDRVLEDAIARLPMFLSRRQEDAIARAFRAPISFVQGPPGTGKSHTITAIMLSALQLGKSVLMVSHKAPAIAVVHRKLAEFLGPYSVALLAPEPARKRDLQAALTHWLNRLGAFHRRAEIRKAEDNAMRQESAFAMEAEQLKRCQRDLQETLSTEHRYFRCNQELVRLRDQFIKAFNHDRPQLERIGARGRLHAKFGRALERVRRLLDSDGRPLRRLDVLFIRRVCVHASRHLLADPDRLDGTLASIQYLEKLLQYLDASASEKRLRRSIAENAVKALRHNVTSAADRLRRTQRDLLEARFAKSVLTALNDDSTPAEAFIAMLRWRRPSRVADAMRNVDFEQLLRTFPLWLGEMRFIGQFLPMAPALFDIVIVDEASQVNIAEILPAFYRGRHICVVGDDKQLGLNSAGLFSLNKCFEELIWNQHVGAHRVPYRHAEEYHLLVSKCSILDFVTARTDAIPLEKTVLDEHFRSLPRLAGFTNGFYAQDGGLTLMRQGSENNHKPCFDAVVTGGVRAAYTKLVDEEVTATVAALDSLIRQRSYLTEERFQCHGYTEDSPPTIGVLSFLTDQRAALQARIESRFSTEDLQRHQVLVGTPEDFQGNERNIMFLTLGLDGASRWGKGHYENPNRFNVATSRASDYTCVIYGALPSNARLLRNYLRHFGMAVEDAVPAIQGNMDHGDWTPADENGCESEFERQVLKHLKHYAAERQQLASIVIYGQVITCGKLRLDFVVVNALSKKGCAVEVDGRDHFCADGKTYSEDHMMRMDILKRSGWKVINLPYYSWYRRGWLCDQGDSLFARTIEECERELDEVLDITLTAESASGRKVETGSP